MVWQRQMTIDQLAIKMSHYFRMCPDTYIKNVSNISDKEIRLFALRFAGGGRLRLWFTDF